jgi:hypothetical protein
MSGLDTPAAETRLHTSKGVNEMKSEIQPEPELSYTGEVFLTVRAYGGFFSGSGVITVDDNGYSLVIHDPKREHVDFGGRDVPARRLLLDLLVAADLNSGDYDAITG